MKEFSTDINIFLRIKNAQLNVTSYEVPNKCKKLLFSKVQPYVPSTPVLYLGMDDDNGRKEGGGVK